ncbi:hypothetical protein DVDV_2880 [Desulfovibrio sp. DV]|uniref:hypothetical protein n=1 Tax=Desulfovibrio sp. DV TaxID=1844708 RepID=UPI00094B98BC|nr:hypothetical protein [Desulfovibrio sp. DV]OLN26082.1 hypothetical protein DVDV_2880 [Desulfovibrio sp. DV]
MAQRKRLAVIAALDRLGLLKYLLAAGITVLAFVLTAGAFCYEQLQKRPPRLSEAARVALARDTPAGPTPGYVHRAPVSRLARFAADVEAEAGFSFYDLSDRETPQSLADKLANKRFRVTRGQGQSCNFAYPLTTPAGDKEAVAAYIRDLGRDCCAAVQVLPGQLATYAFVRNPEKPGGKGGGKNNAPISGAAVFSEVGGGLLTLNLRFSDNAEGYGVSLAKHLSERFGPASPMGEAGSAWARDKGLITVTRTGHTLQVAVYYAANIERHAAHTARLADRPVRQPPPAAGMAVAEAW